jgi:hypothetical protein
MRYFFLTFMLTFSATLCAQTLKEAESLAAAKKYEEAAAIFDRLGHYGKEVEALTAQSDALVKKRKKVEAAALEPKIERAERLARMTSRCEDVQIIDSVVVDKESLLQAYRISDEAGTLLPEGGSVIFENQLKDRRFFGGRREGEQARLYTQVLIADKWSEATALTIVGDSTGNDAFPFIMSDGLTMYFASTGNGSIGGYDIFVSRFDTNTDSYLSPTPLGMPFNSVFNDYLYVVDEFLGIGYFATDRFQPEGKAVVYTFIPNESFLPVDNADEATLASRARIESIRDSWRDGKNYQAMLVKISETIEHKPVTKKKDFTFVVNDNIVYYTLADFESDAARKIWNTALTLQNRIRSEEEKLDRNRKEYSAADKTRRETLKPSILASETQLATLYAEEKEKTKEARNAEIKYLRTKN